jgi:hypothetical protein
MTTEAETNSAAGDDVAASPGVEAEAPENEFDNQSFDDDDGDDGDPADDAPAEDEHEDFEHDGKKLRIPKAIKPLLMMQQDYTKKTTELSEQRRAFEAARAQADTDDTEYHQTHGKVYALKEQLAEYDGLDWMRLAAEDPNLAAQLRMQRDVLKDTLGDVERDLQGKSQARLQSQQQLAAKAMQETGRELASKIKGWSPEVANEIASYGIKEFGVKPEEIRSMADARLWQVLHRAMTAEKALKTQTATQRQERLQATTPAKEVAARPRATPTGLDDRLSAAEWTRRREAQLAARAKR